MTLGSAGGAQRPSDAPAARSHIAIPHSILSGSATVPPSTPRAWTSFPSVASVATRRHISPRLAACKFPRTCLLLPPPSLARSNTVSRSIWNCRRLQRSDLPLGLRELLFLSDGRSRSDKGPLAPSATPTFSGTIFLRLAQALEEIPKPRKLPRRSPADSKLLRRRRPHISHAPPHLLRPPTFAATASRDPASTRPQAFFETLLNLCAHRSLLNSLSPARPPCARLHARSRPDISTPRLLSTSPTWLLSQRPAAVPFPATLTIPTCTSRFPSCPRPARGLRRPGTPWTSRPRRRTWAHPTSAPNRSRSSCRRKEKETAIRKTLRLPMATRRLQWALPQLHNSPRSSRRPSYTSYTSTCAATVRTRCDTNTTQHARRPEHPAPHLLGEH